MKRVEVRELDALADLARCEEIQRSVWGMSEAELVPLAHLRAVQHAGGLVAGAWVESALVGFSYGFPAHRPESPAPCGLHSHMTAVVSNARNVGAGRALKWFQRRWCLDRGLIWVEWTFDPLRAANARLNLEHLGATVGEYLIDAYGPMEDSLNSGMPSDRLVARWELDSPRVAELEKSQVANAPQVNGDADHAALGDHAPLALAVSADGLPTELRLDLGDHELLINVPPDISRLMATSPELAVAWRFAVRETMTHYLRAGYVGRRFDEGAYRFYRRAAKVSM